MNGANGRLTVWRAGWFRPIVVPVAEAKVGYAVNRITRGSFFVPRDTVLPGGADWKGRWVTYEARGIPVWGGRILTTPKEHENRTLELNCASFAELLDYRLTPLDYRPDNGTAGHLVQRAFTDVITDEALAWDIRAQPWGPWLTTEWRADTILSLIQRLERESGQQWRCYVELGGDRPLIVFEWRERVGSDFTGRLLFVLGYNIVSTGSRVDDTAENVRNDLVGIGDGREIARSPVIRRERRTSIENRGRLQGVKRYPVTASGALSNAHVYGDLWRMSDDSPTPTYAMPLGHPYGALIREGDFIRVQDRAVSAEMLCQVMAMEADTVAGTLTLALDEIGEAAFGVRAA